MTRAKYNKNPKLTSEQWILFFKQQTIQVALLMEALDQAYEKIRSLEAQKNKREEEDADEDSVDKEKIIEEKIIEKEEEENDVNECEEKIIEKEEEEDNVNECEEENIKHNDEDKEEEEGRKEGRQKAITGLLWCGTSLSDQALSTLDCSLHTRFSVRKLKAFTINASGATYRPEVNAEDILRNQIKGEEFLILEQGVNEVTNACGETVEEDKQFIASKMRDLVELSQELYERNNLKKVVLLKRLIRCDNVKRTELSRYSDFAMEKAVKENGNGSIVIREMALNGLQELLFGFSGAKNHMGKKTDNLHFRGPIGVQAFTEAAISLLNSL